jgi:hypothetical protein
LVAANRQTLIQSLHRRPDGRSSEAGLHPVPPLGLRARAARWHSPANEREMEFS